MATKPEHHDVVRAFARSLKPPIRLSLAALETLAVIAYKQPVTAPEITEIRGVESAGVLGTLLDRKLITTAGRKQVIGRPILYKTSKEFLLRFGLNDLNELPSMEEFEKLAIDGQVELFTAAPEAPAQEEPETAQAEKSRFRSETALLEKFGRGIPAPPSTEPPEHRAQMRPEQAPPRKLPRKRHRIRRTSSGWRSELDAHCMIEAYGTGAIAKDSSGGRPGVAAQGRRVNYRRPRQRQWRKHHRAWLQGRSAH